MIYSPSVKHPHEMYGIREEVIYRLSCIEHRLQEQLVGKLLTPMAISQMKYSLLQSLREYFPRLQVEEAYNKYCSIDTRKNTISVFMNRRIVAALESALKQETAMKGEEMDTVNVVEEVNRRLGKVAECVWEGLTFEEVTPALFDEILRRVRHELQTHFPLCNFINRRTGVTSYFEGIRVGYANLEPYFDLPSSLLTYLHLTIQEEYPVKARRYSCVSEPVTIE
jgi:hypothetical protein